MRASTAQAMRAVLLASATETTLAGLRSSSRAAQTLLGIGLARHPDDGGRADDEQAPDVAVALLADAAAAAPCRRCYGRAGSGRARPRTAAPIGTATHPAPPPTIALAVIGPMPGIVASRRLVGVMRGTRRRSPLSSLADLGSERVELVDQSGARPIRARSRQIALYRVQFARSPP